MAKPMEHSFKIQVRTQGVCPSQQHKQTTVLSTNQAESFLDLTLNSEFQVPKSVHF